MKKYATASAVSLVASLALVTIASAAIIVPPPPQLPTTKEQCKKGGWQDFGSTFKNQGDCVSYVATGGSNGPDGSTN